MKKALSKIKIIVFFIILISIITVTRVNAFAGIPKKESKIQNINIVEYTYSDIDYGESDNEGNYGFYGEGNSEDEGEDGGEYEGEDGGEYEENDDEGNVGFYGEGDGDDEGEDGGEYEGDDDDYDDDDYDYDDDYDEEDDDYYEDDENNDDTESKNRMAYTGIKNHYILLICTVGILIYSGIKIRRYKDI